MERWRKISVASRAACAAQLATWGQVASRAAGHGPVAAWLPRAAVRPARRPRLGATMTGAGKSAGPGHPGPAVAALAPAWPAGQYPPHAACHLRGAVRPRPEARTPGRNPWPAGTAGHTSALTCRALAAAGSAQRTCRFGRSRLPAPPPGNTLPPPWAHGRCWWASRARPSRRPISPGALPAGFTVRDGIGRDVGDPSSRDGVRALDHWSRDLSS